MNAGRIAVCGAVAQKPGHPGHTWQFLQYLLGFRRLGFDVLLVDRIGDPEHGGVEYVRQTLDRFGLDWTIVHDGGRHSGLSRTDTLAWVRSADLLLNVMGFCTDEELLAAARWRVFFDTDPGFGQMWHALGLADLFSGHDAYLTIGERIGTPDCRVPSCGLRWETTRQPVVLSEWPAAPAPPGELTFGSIATWRGAYAPIEYEGRRFGLRAHEFRRFADLPHLTGRSFELALDIDPADDADRELLVDGGFTLRDPRLVTSTLDGYRNYVRGAWAELMVAKEMYVRSRSGWFSERSACYLASGRPVLAQDTGLDGLLPIGEGVLTFTDLEEAVGAVEAVARDWPLHSRAARDVAEAYFDSDRVLGRLLDVVGKAPSPSVAA
jgi:hypothetical protein